MIKHLDWLYTRYNGVSERWAFDLFIPDELYTIPESIGPGRLRILPVPGHPSPILSSLR